VLDAFWDSKGYITPQQHRRYCGPTVPLARMSKRVFTTDEEFTASAEVAHFGAKNLENVKTIWRVRDAAGKILQSGSLNPATVKTGGQTSLGEIHIGKGNLPAPAKLNLEISLDGVDAANDWDFWVYPSSVATDAPTGVRIATSLDDEAMNFVNGGGKLLLVPPSANIAGNALPSFGPLFWNNITFPGGNRVHTLGILCDPKHPALAEFPTDFHSNWQWWDLTHSGKPMILTDLPKDLHPLVQTIDDWLTCRKLALAFEAKVGQGKLILTSMDLTQNLESRPVARQMRRSLLDYMTTADFSPRVTLTDAQLRSRVK
jgi:hypothetical protein